MAKNKQYDKRLLALYGGYMPGNGRLNFSVKNWSESCRPLV